MVGCSLWHDLPNSRWAGVGVFVGFVFSAYKRQPAGEVIHGGTLYGDPVADCAEPVAQGSALNTGL